MTQALIQPGQIVTPGSEPPYLRLPDAQSLFRDRAARFRHLASGHSLGAFLGFLARLAEGQHLALQRHAGVSLPDAASLARSRAHAMPPLAAATWRRDPAWRDDLACLLDHLAPCVTGDAGRLVANLRGAAPAELEAMADAVLAGGMDHPRAAALPLVAAALQVYWTRMAVALGPDAYTRLDVPGVCPVCGSPPVASVVRVGGDEAGLRYLHCALCSSEWNLVRVKCSQCESTAGIAYHHLEGAHPAVRAETCDTCHSYLKLVTQEQDPLADPVADDLASLALDVLVDEKGYARSGPNLLFVPGRGDA